MTIKKIPFMLEPHRTANQSDKAAGEKAMQGLELSKKYYENNKDVFAQKFPQIYGQMAFGLAGEGSECFGFDDEISRDHDFEPSFCIWVPEEIEQKYGAEIQKIYEALPKTLDTVTLKQSSAYGKNRRGVCSIEKFYRDKTGGEKGPRSLQDWLFVPEYTLAEAVNGEIFSDLSGKFTEIRESLLRGYPEDVRKKKIAARAAYMAQSGQYNYRRCLARGEMGAARLALDLFVSHTIQMIYLLNNRYCPYYKWIFRGMNRLSLLGELSEGLTALLCAPDSDENIKVKMALIEQICGQVISELKKQGLSDESSDYLEPHAFAVMQTIEDGNLKKMHAMAGIMA